MPALMSPTHNMSKDPVSKIPALTIFREQFRDTALRSTARLSRLRRACEAFGLNDEEMAYAEYLADYRPHPAAGVYPLFKS